MSSLRIMTFNLRFDTPQDGRNQWGHRREHVTEVIERYHPLCFGTQEGLVNQLEDLTRSLQHPYERFGAPREPNSEHQQIFFDTDFLEKIDGDTFWLSDTPEKAGTKGWDAKHVRVATWCHLRLIATGHEFFLCNTQLDHIGQVARLEGAKLIASKMNAIAGGKTLFIIGDFNTYRDSDVYRFLTKDTTGPKLFDAWTETDEQIGDVSCSFHGWEGVDGPHEKGENKGERHIDWILFRPKMQVLSTEVITEHRDGRYPSDHYPIQAEIDLDE